MTYLLCFLLWAPVLYMISRRNPFTTISEKESFRFSIIGGILWPVTIPIVIWYLLKGRYRNKSH